MSDLERIIDGLTQPQRHVVSVLTEKPVRARRSRFSAQAAFNLVRQGITALGFDLGSMRDTYYLTPLGMAVKDALAAGARSDETAQLAQSEGRQSGAESATPNSPNTSSTQSDGRGL